MMETAILQGIFLLLFGGSLLYALLRGSGETAAAAMLSAAGEGLQNAIGLAGGFAFFCGLTAILKHAGAATATATALGRAMRPLLTRMGIPAEALEATALNLSANLLGMGGAATPMGLRAVRHMAENGRASDGLYLPAAGVKSSRHAIPCVLLS